MLPTIDQTSLDNVTGGTVRGSSSSDALLQSLQGILTSLQSSNNNNNNGGLNNNTMLLMCMLAMRPANNVVYVRRGGWGWCG